VHVPHEALNEDVLADQSFVAGLQQAITNKSLPQRYYEHPVVLQNPSKLVLPMAIFIDGLPYSLTDSVIGFWLVNLSTGARYFFAALRKRHVCSCGCRGWCTYYVIFRFILWSINAMATGIFPSCRHDGSPWSIGLL
jgi:hypothetical protein